MADTTTVLAMPFPEGSDANDVPADIQALAERIDEVPGIESLTSAEISGLAAGEKPAGRVVYNSTTSKLQVSNGSTFANIDAAALLLAGGTMTGAIAMGSNKITGLAAGTSNGDAVRYEQLTALEAEVDAIGAYSAWTPTLTASSSNPTASATASENRYAQTGKRVSGWGHMNVTAAGGGTYRLPLPVAPRSTSAAYKPIGWVTLIVDSGGTYARSYRLVQVASQTYCHAIDFDSSTVPGVNMLSNTDVSDIDSRGGSVYLTWQFDYEAA